MTSNLAQIRSGMSWLLVCWYDCRSLTAEYWLLIPLLGGFGFIYSHVLSFTDANWRVHQQFLSWRSWRCQYFTSNYSPGAKLCNHLEGLHHALYAGGILSVSMKSTIGDLCISCPIIGFFRQLGSGVEGVDGAVHFVSQQACLTSPFPFLLSSCFLFPLVFAILRRLPRRGSFNNVFQVIDIPFESVL